MSICGCGNPCGCGCGCDCGCRRETCQTPEPPCDCEEMLCRIQSTEENIANLFKRTDDISNYLNENPAGLGVMRIGFVADQGSANITQLQTANLFIDKEVHYAIFGGDNNYPSGETATITANWDAFIDFINRGVAFPVAGNHDLENTGTKLAPQITKFPYITYENNGHFYHKYFPGFNLGIVFLNSGLKNSGTLVEAAGNTVGSDQYDWMVSIQAMYPSNTRWIAVFHHPYINTYQTGSSITAMEWGFEDKGFVATLNGHTHTLEHILHGGLHIINASASANSQRVSTKTLKNPGAFSDCSLVWSYGTNVAAGPPGAVILEVTPGAIVVNFYDVTTQQSLHSFVI